MAHHLPDDAWTEIFVRATAETLVRCTSVCKHWQSIITRPTFIETHLNHQKTRNLLIIRTCPIASQKEYYSWHCDDVPFTVCGCQPPIDQSSKQFYQIAGSCNGILCLADGVDDIFLWNPAIRKWFKLQPPPITCEKHFQYEHITGFGFDAASNDYKVINIINHKGYVNVSPKIAIYSLSSGAWKDISHLADGLEHLSFRQKNQSFVNGATHWIACDKTTRREMVVSFHMSDEVFCRIQLPTSSSYFRPLVIEGLLSVVEADHLMQKYCIWTMKEYGMGSSWSKFLDLNFSVIPGRIIGFRKSSQALINVRGALYSYDLHAEDENASNRLQDMGIPCRYGMSLHVESFVESLVLFGRRTDVEDDEIMVASLSLGAE